MKTYIIQYIVYTLKCILRQTCIQTCIQTFYIHKNILYTRAYINIYNICKQYMNIHNICKHTHIWIYVIYTWTYVFTNDIIGILLWNFHHSCVCVPGNMNMCIVDTYFCDSAIYFFRLEKWHIRLLLWTLITWVKLQELT